MLSARFVFCYTEFTFMFSGCRRASVCIILAGTPSVGQPALAGLPPSSAASTSPVGPASSDPGSGRRSGENVGIIDAGFLLVSVFVQRPQRAGHEFILLKSVFNINTNHGDSCGSCLGHIVKNRLKNKARKTGWTTSEGRTEL